MTMPVLLCASFVCLACTAARLPEQRRYEVGDAVASTLSSSAGAAPIPSAPTPGASGERDVLGEPAPVELLARASGRLSFVPQGRPASGVPFVIKSECETLAGITDQAGRFEFRNLRLPAVLRSTDGLYLTEHGMKTGSSEGIELGVASRGTPSELRPIGVWALRVIAEVKAPRDQSGARAAEIGRFLSGLDVLGPSEGEGRAIMALPAPAIDELRRHGFEITPMDASSNHYAVVGERASKEEWARFRRERLARAREGLRLSMLGHSRRPLGRVRTDAACLARRRAATETGEP